MHQLHIKVWGKMANQNYRGLSTPSDLMRIIIQTMEL